MLLTFAGFGHHVVAAFTFFSLCSFGEICNGWDLAKGGAIGSVRGGKVGKTQGEREKERHVAKAYSTQYSLVGSQQVLTRPDTALLLRSEAIGFLKGGVAVDISSCSQQPRSPCCKALPLQAPFTRARRSSAFPHLLCTGGPATSSNAPRAAGRLPPLRGDSTLSGCVASCLRDKTSWKSWK